jgi:hypothetical protein
MYDVLECETREDGNHTKTLTESLARHFQSRPTVTSTMEPQNFVGGDSVASQGAVQNECLQHCTPHRRVCRLDSRLSLGRPNPEDAMLG